MVERNIRRESGSGRSISEGVILGLRRVVPEIHAVHSGTLGRGANYHNARKIYASDVFPHIETPDDMQYIGWFFAKIPDSERPLVMTSDLSLKLDVRYGFPLTAYGQDAIDKLQEIVSGKNLGQEMFQFAKTPMTEIANTLRVTFGDETARLVLADALAIRTAGGIGTEADRETLKEIVASLTGGIATEERLKQVLAGLRNL